MSNDPLTSGRASRPSLAWLARPGLLLAAGVVLAVVSLHLWIDPSNPPGFHRDEASIAYNASTISTSLRDEHGGRLPLYFESFGDYKSPVFVYALAGVFRLTGPSSEVARGLGAVGVLAAVLLLGLLALRRTRDIRVAAAVVALSGFSPWLFELGRVAVEVTLEPLVFVVLLLVLEAAWRRNRWGVVNGIAAGGTLALLAYTYAGARLLAPLLAAALLVFAKRGRLRWLATAWATFVVLLIPLIAYAVRHPGALSARFHHTTFVKDNMSGLGGGADLCRELPDRHQPVVLRHRRRSKAAHPHHGDRNAAGDGCSPRCGGCGALDSSRPKKIGGPRSCFSPPCSFRFRPRSRPTG